MKNNITNEFGKAYIIPTNKFVVGITTTFTLVYEVGEKSLTEGKGLLIETPGNLGWSRPQLSCGWEEGFITIKTSNFDVEVDANILPVTDISFKREKAIQRLIQIIVKKGQLIKGEKIFITFGDKHKGFGIGYRLGILSLSKNFREEITVRVIIDKEKNKYFKLPNQPYIKLINSNVNYYRVTIPSIVNPSENFYIHIKPEDEFYNPCFNNENKLEIVGLNNKIKLQVNSKGITEIKQNISKKGIYYYIIKDNNKRKFKSNPVLVSESKEKIFWGDLHSHSSFSLDNKFRDRMVIPPKELFQFTKNVNNLDFLAITDHHEPWDPKKALTDEEWKELKKAVKSEYKPGKFVSFLGYEFRCKRGDTCVYFKDVENVPKGGKEIDCIEKLWEFYSSENIEILTIPHFHHLFNFQFRKDGYYNNPWEKLVEIYSGHGRFEYYDNYLHRPYQGMIKGRSVVDKLSLGIKYGIVAASDDHKGHPGHQGLTAVFAESLTREAIFDALKKRRCYGTTNARILLYFKINDHFMGEEFNYIGEPELYIRAIGTDKIVKVEIIKNGKVIFTQKSLKNKIELKYKDKEFKENSYYYIRVTQQDYEMAWSSPIWINCE